LCENLTHLRVFGFGELANVRSRRTRNATFSPTQRRRVFETLQRSSFHVQRWHCWQTDSFNWPSKLKVVTERKDAQTKKQTHGRIEGMTIEASQPSFNVQQPPREKNPPFLLSVFVHSSTSITQRFA
jgi:hypothetical protein